MKGEDLVSAKKEEEKEEQAWRERSLWGNELKKGKGKEKSKGDGKGDGSEAGKGKPAPDLRPVSSMRCAFFDMFCASGELREWMAALWCGFLDTMQIWLVGDCTLIWVHSIPKISRKNISNRRLTFVE